MSRLPNDSGFAEFEFGIDMLFSASAMLCRLLSCLRQFFDGNTGHRFRNARE